jgi:hypothetical protein
MPLWASPVVDKIPKTLCSKAKVLRISYLPTPLRGGLTCKPPFKVYWFDKHQQMWLAISFFPRKQGVSEELIFLRYLLRLTNNDLRLEFLQHQVTKGILYPQFKI